MSARKYKSYDLSRFLKMPGQTTLELKNSANKVKTFPESTSVSEGCLFISLLQQNSISDMKFEISKRATGLIAVIYEELQTDVNHS